MLINHLSLNAFSGWCKCVGGLASFAETPQSDPGPDGWAPHYRDEINLGYQDILKWAESLNGQPWPPGAKMTRAELVGAIELLHGDALQLVTVLQNSDCWGIRYSAWPCVADRELVDRVRRAVADLSRLIVFLTALAIDQEQKPEAVAVASEAAVKVVVGEFTGKPAKSEAVAVVPVAAADPQQAAGDDQDKFAKRMVCLLDDDTLKVSRVVEDGSKTVDERLRIISAIDRRFYGKDSPELAGLFDVKPPAIRKTAWWKVDRVRANAADSEVAGVEDL